MYDLRKQYISFVKASVSDKQQMCFVRGDGQKGTKTYNKDLQISNFPLLTLIQPRVLLRVSNWHLEIKNFKCCINYTDRE